MANYFSVTSAISMPMRITKIVHAASNATERPIPRPLTGKLWPRTR